MQGAEGQLENTGKVLTRLNFRVRPGRASEYWDAWRYRWRMIRGFFRLIGLLLLVGGFIFMVYDGARWVADQSLRFTRFGQFWNDIHQSSQQAFRTWVESNVPWLWNSVITVLLDQPVFAVGGGPRARVDALFPPRQAADRLQQGLSLRKVGSAAVTGMPHRA